MGGVILQLLPALVLCLYLKVVRVSLLCDPGVLGSLAALVPEVGVQLLLLSTAAWGLRVARMRATQVAVRIAFSGVALSFALLESVALMFAWETGSPLDHHLFAFALAQARSLIPLFVAVAPASKLSSLALIAIAWFGWQIWQIARQHHGAIRPRTPVALFGAGALLLAVAPLCVPLSMAMPMPVELAVGPWLRPARIASTRALRPHARDATLQPIELPVELPVDSDAKRAEGYENLVIVVLESTGYFATDLSDPSRATTPHLRELAEKSVVFDRAYAAVPHSSKALVAIGCGIYPHLMMHVVESEPAGVPVRCLPDLLRGLGFQTLYFGSHVGGFENWRQLTRNLGFAVTVTVEQIDTEGYEVANYFAYEDDATLPASRAWLERSQGKRIFALYLTSTAHHDYRTPTRYGLQDFSDDERENHYLNSIYYQDRFLEKLLDQYRELGLYERTLFVIVGDHGEAFGEHGFKLHDGVIYEEGIRVPLLLHGAGLAARRVPNVVSQVDILPTLVALLGYRIDAGTYDGGNLLEKDEGSVAHASCWYSERCIARIARDRKIVSHFGHREAEAYAIDADPRERRDVFGTRSDDPRSLDALHAWKREQLGRSTAFYQRRPGIPGP